MSSRRPWLVLRDALNVYEPAPGDGNDLQLFNNMLRGLEALYPSGGKVEDIVKYINRVQSNLDYYLGIASRSAKDVVKLNEEVRKLNEELEGAGALENSYRIQIESLHRQADRHRIQIESLLKQLRPLVVTPKKKS
jgi:hypothetical protein